MEEILAEIALEDELLKSKVQLEPLPQVVDVVIEKIDSGQLASIAATKATIAVEARMA